MIDKGIFTSMVDELQRHVGLTARFDEARVRSEGASLRRYYIDAVVENAALVELHRERLFCYVLSSGAECPTLEELRKVKEV